MTTMQPVLPRVAVRRGIRVGLFGGILIASMAGVSAHVVRGLINPALATAFVSSPSAGSDAPVRLAWGAHDTGLRVACFFAANTSVPRADDANWPRITTVGFELPGSPVGFSLVEPLDGQWELVEGRKTAIPGHGTVVLDFAIVARVNRAGFARKGPRDPGGIPPGQLGVRGSGTRFCVSGPFPDAFPNPAAPNEPIVTTIEQIINGVLVGFQRVQRHGLSTDVGVWENPQRVIPLYVD